MDRRSIIGTVPFIQQSTSTGSTSSPGSAKPLVRRTPYKKSGNYGSSPIEYPNYDISLTQIAGTSAIFVNKTAPARWTAVNQLEIDYTVSFPVATSTNLDLLIPPLPVMVNNVYMMTFTNLGLNIADIDIMQSPSQAATIRFNKRTAFVKSLRFTVQYTFNVTESVTLLEGEFSIDCWHIPVGFGKGINGINHNILQGLQCADLNGLAVAPGVYTAFEYTVKHFSCNPEQGPPMQEYLFYIAVDK